MLEPAADHVHPIIEGSTDGATRSTFAVRPPGEIHASEDTIEIFIEADFETLPEERRRFAIVNVPSHRFSEATGAIARRAGKE